MIVPVELCLINIATEISDMVHDDKIQKIRKGKFIPSRAQVLLLCSSTKNVNYHRYQIVISFGWNSGKEKT